MRTWADSIRSELPVHRGPNPSARPLDAPAVAQVDAHPQLPMTPSMLAGVQRAAGNYAAVRLMALQRGGSTPQDVCPCSDERPDAHADAGQLATVGPRGPDTTSARDASLQREIVTIPEMTISGPRSLRDTLGTLDYYRLRHADFVDRHSADDPPVAPPRYYLGYGDKYVRRFTQLKPGLSSDGQRWLSRTLFLLQFKIENQLDASPGKFAQLEEKDEAFTDFAYGTHPDAYVEAGICELSKQDQMRIAWGPDSQDVWSPRGQAQIEEVVRQCLGRSAPIGPYPLPFPVPQLPRPQRPPPWQQ
jgi:hypothetical protein